MPSLVGQAALVTGGSSGIGAAISVTLASAGAQVAVNYLSNAAPAQKIIEAIRQEGGEALAVRADVARSDDVRRMFEMVVSGFGRLDILVANAGIQQDGAVADLTLDQWQNVLDVNLTGQFLCRRKRSASSVISSGPRIPGRAARSSASARCTRRSLGRGT